MKLVVTGGAGFIGSNYLLNLISRRDIPYLEIVIIDNLTYSGTLDNIDTIVKDSRVNFIEGDICDVNLVRKHLAGVDQIVHFAAESHVDRSIHSSEQFIKTNVQGTHTLLEAFKENRNGTFLHVSTDEVYGSINEGKWSENFGLSPNSPYSASKASSDLIALAFHRTYGLDIRVSRCCNNFGPRQYPEKLIPLLITNIIRGKKLPIYGNGLNVREWIHVDDHCDALNKILESGKPGEIYNIGTTNEQSNIEIANLILKIMGKSPDLIAYVEDRAGHDFRYALDTTKARNELGFSPKKDFAEAIQETVKWYLENQQWWESKVIN